MFKRRYVQLQHRAATTAKLDLIRKRSQNRLRCLSYDEDRGIRQIADVSAHAKRIGKPLYKPAEANTLDSTSDDHFPRSHNLLTLS